MIPCAGPTLRFMVEGVAAVCGAQFAVEVDGNPAPLWESFTVPQGASLTVGSVRACLHKRVVCTGDIQAATLGKSCPLETSHSFPSSGLVGTFVH